jgi:6-phosphogluconate dehydrogenase
VKMVHNGIEYGVMQLIAEVYHIMHKNLNMNNEEIHDVFSNWQKGKLSSYLVEITAAIFLKKDELVPNHFLVDAILDKASQKGTGKWTSIEGLNLGVPIPTIDAGVNARNFSNQKSLRTALTNGKELSGQKSTHSLTIDELENALYFSIICAYIQGFSMIQEASNVYNYDVDCLQVAKTWRGGCIIKADLLDHFISVFSKNQRDLHLLQTSDFADLLKENKAGLKKTVAIAQQNEVPVIGLSSALNYHNSLHSATLPANLIQAQRDFFGAHTYQRTDRPGTFHSDWEQKS